MPHICSAMFRSSAMFVLLFQALLCLFTTQTRAASTYLYHFCPNTTVFTPNSTYQSNLKTLFSFLSSNATNPTGFYFSPAGINSPEAAYGAFLCRGDVSPKVCSDCVSNATQEALQRCPRSRDFTVWYDVCMLRYNPRSFFGDADESPYVILRNETQNVTDPESFEDLLEKTLSDIANRASAGSGKKFAVGKANFSAFQTLYGLAQCTPELDVLECNQCLRSCISNFASCCVGNQGAMLLFPSCTVRYELYPFYDATAVAPPPSPPPRPPPIPPPPPPPPPVKPKGGISKGGLVAIIASIVVSILLFIILGFCWLTRKKKPILKRYDSLDKDGDNDDITTEHSLQYDLGTIQVATNNFSRENKIGEGGFGSVYKGVLSNGQEIAVKRLSQSSRQGATEFKNEVLVVAKLQHRNLTRLRGFCLQAGEKILIYEYVPNKSLDYLLFDPKESAKLDWSTRYKIIGGIARGMLYLHEDSRLRIIHRDLKASNVLLDADMNAKVSDFGLAKIFGDDQTQGSTSRVVGTYGYMSPEYAMHGQFSVKSDVFSFGVLVLEIVRGKKNSSFYLSDCGDNLLSHAWKLWREGNHLELVDPVLEGSYARSEVTQCIHIGLLCVQEDAYARPSMATVKLMLNSYSVTLPVPQEPAFFFRSKARSQKNSQSMQFSVNDDSITEVTLPDFMLADQLTSQVQAIRSLEFYICYYGWGDYKHRQNTCKENSVYNTFYFIVAAIPYWIRLLQCLRRVVEEKDAWQGLNGLKYFSTIVAVCARTAYTLNKSPSWNVIAWVTSAISAIFCTCWDIVIDWDFYIKI